MEQKTILVSDVLGKELIDDFMNFDLTEVQEVMASLRIENAIDLPHAERLAQYTLRCADLLCEFSGKLTKTVSHYESKINSEKNKASLNYESPAGKTTMEMRKWAGEIDPAVISLQEDLARAKGSKLMIEKKLDIILKAHHHYKDLCSGLRRTVLGYREQ